MRIVLIKSKTNTLGFAKFLARFIRHMYIRELNLKKLIRADRYLSEEVTKGNKRRIRAYETVVRGFNNLHCVNTSKTVVIEINPIVKVPYYDNVSLESVCKLINSGNSDLNPYPIFTDVFTKVVKNINKLYKLYNSPVGGGLFT